MKQNLPFLCLNCVCHTLFADITFTTRGGHASRQLTSNEMEGRSGPDAKLGVGVPGPIAYNDCFLSTLKQLYC